MVPRRIQLVFSAIGVVVVVVVLLVVIGVERTSPKTANSTAPTCLRSQLHVALVGVSGGLGHAGSVIRVRHVSGEACSLTGYPRVAEVFASRVPRIFKDTLDGYLGGVDYNPLDKVKPLVVTLRARHGVASSMEEADLRHTCPSITSYVVSLPHVTGGTYTFYLHRPDRYCFEPEVHPLVPGSTGDAGIA